MNECASITEVALVTATPLFITVARVREESGFWFIVMGWSSSLLSQKLEPIQGTVNNENKRNNERLMTSRCTVSSCWGHWSLEWAVTGHEPSHNRSRKM